jgi:hypothetical protein
MKIKEMLSLESGTEVICTKGAKKIYSGWYGEHDSEKCRSCLNGGPCQYAVEAPWYKLGYMEVKKGEEFIIDEVHEDNIRFVYKKDKTMTISVWENSGMQFEITKKR